MLPVCSLCKVLWTLCCSLVYTKGVETDPQIYEFGWAAYERFLLVSFSNVMLSASSS